MVGLQRHHLSFGIRNRTRQYGSTPQQMAKKIHQEKTNTAQPYGKDTVQRAGIPDENLLLRLCRHLYKIRKPYFFANRPWHFRHINNIENTYCKIVITFRH